MQGSNKVIEHSGIVTEIGERLVKVTISSVSQCAACHAKGACSAADMQDKVIDAIKPDWDVNVNDRVIVEISRHLGVWALFFGYVFPLILVVTVLFTVGAFGVSELNAGLISLGSLVPYYGLLVAFRKRLSKNYSFRIRMQE
jgi:sigma-E factor negative regulatory protein RseC